VNLVPDSSLIVLEGTTVYIPLHASITNHGSVLTMYGDRDAPVTLLFAQDEAEFVTSTNSSLGWGQVRIDSGGRLLALHVIVTGAGADVSNAWGHSSSEPAVRVVGKRTAATLIGGGIVDCPGKAIGSQEAEVFLEDLLISRVDTGGEHRASKVTMRNCHVLEIPGARPPSGSAPASGQEEQGDDNDGVYLKGVYRRPGRPKSLAGSLITGCVFSQGGDDAIDVNGAAVLVHRTLIDGWRHEGVAASGRSSWSIVMILDSRIESCEQGVEAGYGAPQILARDVLVKDCVVGFRFGDGYDWKYSGRLTALRGAVVGCQVPIMNHVWRRSPRTKQRREVPLSELLAAPRNGVPGTPHMLSLGELVNHRAFLWKPGQLHEPTSAEDSPQPGEGRSGDGDAFYTLPSGEVAAGAGGPAQEPGSLSIWCVSVGVGHRDDASAGRMVPTTVSTVPGSSVRLRPALRGECGVEAREASTEPRAAEELDHVPLGRAFVQRGPCGNRSWFDTRMSTARRRWSELGSQWSGGGWMKEAFPLGEAEAPTGIGPAVFSRVNAFFLDRWERQYNSERAYPNWHQLPSEMRTVVPVSRSAAAHFRPVMEALSHIRSPRVARVQHVCAPGPDGRVLLDALEQENYAFVMSQEMAPGVPINRRGKAASPEGMLDLAMELVRAVKALHESPVGCVVHGDLKWGNIIAHPSAASLRLIDFDNAVLLSSCRRARNASAIAFCCDMGRGHNHLAPECQRCQTLSAASDVYVVGQRLMNFFDHQRVNVFKQVGCVTTVYAREEKGKQEVKPQINGGGTDDDASCDLDHRRPLPFADLVRQGPSIGATWPGMLELMEACLDIEPARRPEIAEVLDRLLFIRGTMKTLPESRRRVEAWATMTRASFPPSEVAADSDLGSGRPLSPPGFPAPRSAWRKWHAAIASATNGSSLVVLPGATERYKHSFLAPRGRSWGGCGLRFLASSASPATSMRLMVKASHSENGHFDDESLYREIKTSALDLLLGTAVVPPCAGVRLDLSQPGLASARATLTHGKPELVAIDHAAKCLRPEAGRVDASMCLFLDELAAPEAADLHQRAADQALKLFHSPSNWTEHGARETPGFRKGRLIRGAAPHTTQAPRLQGVQGAGGKMGASHANVPEYAILGFLANCAKSAHNHFALAGHKGGDKEYLVMLDNDRCFTEDRHGPLNESVYMPDEHRHRFSQWRELLWGSCDWVRGPVGDVILRLRWHARPENPSLSESFKRLLALDPLAPRLISTDFQAFAEVDSRAQALLDRVDQCLYQAGLGAMHAATGLPLRRIPALASRCASPGDDLTTAGGSCVAGHEPPFDWVWDYAVAWP